MNEIESWTKNLRLKMFKLFILLLTVICVSNAQEISIEPEVPAISIEPENEAIETETSAQYTEENTPTIVDENDENGATTLAEVDDQAKLNVTTESVTPNTTKVNCLSNKEYGPVEMVNASRLMELLNSESGPGNKSRTAKEGKQLPGVCILVLFYARWCVFSSQAAPHFNAMPRVFPHLKIVAIDAIKHQSFNTQYGIVGVPTLMLFHNGKPVSKFNGTEYTVEKFHKFIQYSTNLESSGLLYLTSAEFAGPVPSTPSNETDYCLLLSWTFIAACSLYFTSKSRWWRQFVELVQNTWRESNAQHEHTD